MPTLGESGSRSTWRHRFAVATLLSTLALIFIGGLVTSKGAGLSVPDWPLSYGMLMPPMVGNVLYEHGHRMAATLVGGLTLVLAFWTSRAEPRRPVRWLAWGALAAVTLQGLLGGLTVLLLLPTPISVAHACLAQTFLCLLVALSYSTSPEWERVAPRKVDVAGVRGLALFTTGLVFVQLLVGAVVRHTGSGLAIPDFPLALGRIVPPLETAAVAIHFLHRIVALAVLVTAALLVRACRRSGLAALAGPALVLLALVVAQIGLGAATVLTAKGALVTTFHVATGAAILALCWFVALRSRRLLDSGRPVGRSAAAEDIAAAA
jgi:heme a synthase